MNGIYEQVIGLIYSKFKICSLSIVRRKLIRLNRGSSRFNDAIMCAIKDRRKHLPRKMSHLLLTRPKTMDSAYREPCSIAPSSSACVTAVGAPGPPPSSSHCSVCLSGYSPCCSSCSGCIGILLGTIAGRRAWAWRLTPCAPHYTSASATSSSSCSLGSASLAEYAADPSLLLALSGE